MTPGDALAFISGLELTAKEQAIAKDVLLEAKDGSLVRDEHLAHPRGERASIQAPAGADPAPALALVGRGGAAAAQVDARTVDQSTGDAAVVYPSEFREGLDHYFGELDGGR